MNIFAQYQIDIPIKYQDQIKSYVSTGGTGSSKANTPFLRQVDFWYMALVVAFNKGFEPVVEKETYNAVTAEILSRNDYRIHHMQLIALAHFQDPSVLAEPRKVLDYCLSLANAGIPYVISILQSPDNLPMWNIFDEIEDMC